MQIFYLVGFGLFCLESLLSLWVLQVRFFIFTKVSICLLLPPGPSRIFVPHVLGAGFKATIPLSTSFSFFCDLGFLLCFSPSAENLYVLQGEQVRDNVGLELGYSFSSVAASHFSGWFGRFLFLLLCIC